MKLSEITERVNNDPELRRIAYEEERRRRAARFEIESTQSPRRPDREILDEIKMLGEGQADLFNADYPRDGRGRIDCRAYRARFDRIAAISDRIAMLRRELSGLGAQTSTQPGVCK
jgi:hypothetical protein